MTLLSRLDLNDNKLSGTLPGTLAGAPRAKFPIRNVQSLDGRKLGNPYGPLSLMKGVEFHLLHEGCGALKKP